MARGETKHLFALAGVSGVYRHRHHPASSRTAAAGGRAHPAATARAGCRVIRIHRRNGVLARAIVNLNRAFQIALNDIDHAHVHPAHAHLAALAQALDHGRALHVLPGHICFDRDLEISADWLVGVWFALG